MFVHSAGLHVALDNASTRGVPDFNKHHHNVKEVLKRVLAEDSFSVAYNNFNQDQRQLVEHCLKVCAPYSNYNRLNLQFLGIPADQRGRYGHVFISSCPV